MYCVRSINADYTWVGADCRRLAMFEGVFGVPDGISFNSYLLRDEKTVLFDTADIAVSRQFRENLHHTLNGRTLDYIVVQHMEPDHTAALMDIVAAYPAVQIYCSAMAKTMISQFFDDSLADRIVTVKDGDSLCAGRHTLSFITAPMVHWPEVLMTYDATDHLLLTADAFGGFGALNGHLFADEVDFQRDYLDETRRYYTNIVGKYGQQVQAVLKKASALDIQMLLPLHGLVWRRNLSDILHKYDQWSRYEPEDRCVMIAYASVYGDTENAANILACKLVEKGVAVQMFDTSVTPASYIVSAAFRCSHLVFAATTYNMGVFITMDELLRDIAAHNLQNRTAVLIENGSWAPASGREMKKIIEPLSAWKLLDTSISLRSSVKTEQLSQLEDLAQKLHDDMQQGSEAVQETAKTQYVCQVCGYVYKGDTLPEGFTCPICGRDASHFEKKNA
jgi:flavorubredoxin/rubredoxin